MEILKRVVFVSGKDEEPNLGVLPSTQEYLSLEMELVRAWFR